MGLQGCYSIFVFFENEKDNADLNESVKAIKRNIEKIDNHNICDLWEIPLLINDIVPEYKPDCVKTAMKN